MIDGGGNKHVKRRILIVIASLLFQSTSSAAATRYVNCARQGDGGPLMECAYLTVDLSRDEIMIGHNGEIIEKACSSRDYLCTGSAILPIALPTSDYEHRSSWEFAGRRYEKRSIRAPSPFPWRCVDLIMVYDVAGRLVMSFWYDKEKGVVATGFPQNGQNSGEVFHLSDDVGLFHNRAAAGTCKSDR